MSDIGMGAYKGIELFEFLWQDIADKLCIENNIKAVLLSKVKDRTIMAREYKKMLEKDEFGSKMLLKTTIKDSIKFAEAEQAQTPINFYKNNPGADQYREVAKELFERGVL